MIIVIFFSYLIQIHFISVSDLIDRSDPFTQLKSNSIEDQNGYKFSFDRLLKNGDKTWRCAKRRSKCKCQAYVKTRENLIILQYYKHNHHPYGTNSSIGGFFWINILWIFTPVGLFLVRRFALVGFVVYCPVHLIWAKRWMPNICYCYFF